MDLPAGLPSENGLDPGSVSRGEEAIAGDRWTFDEEGRSSQWTNRSLPAGGAFWRKETMRSSSTLDPVSVRLVDRRRRRNMYQVGLLQYWEWRQWCRADCPKGGSDMTPHRVCVQPAAKAHEFSVRRGPVGKQRQTTYVRT